MEFKHKTSIRDVDMGEFLNNEYKVEYIDGDIVIVEDLKGILRSNPVRFNLILIVICIEGSLQLDVNEKTCVISKNEILFCAPRIILDNYCISTDFKGRICGLSDRYMHHMLQSSQYIWNKAFYLFHHPVLRMSEGDMELINLYYDLILLKVKRQKRFYHEEVMKMLFQAAFFEFSANQCDLISDTQANLTSQGDILFHKFMELLYKTKVKARSVSWFAERLHITPKYLSAVAKKVSGKTASQWINEYITEDIKMRLKHSTLSIKEIALELDFPSISFFGKYVKAHLGMSPKNYRKQICKHPYHESQ